MNIYREGPPLVLVGTMTATVDLNGPVVIDESGSLCLPTGFRARVDIEPSGGPSCGWAIILRPNQDPRILPGFVATVGEVV